MRRLDGCQCEHADKGPCEVHRFEVGDNVNDYTNAFDNYGNMMYMGVRKGVVLETLVGGWIVVVDIEGETKPHHRYCHRLERVES